MDMADGVAVRSAALCLDGKGRVPEFVLWDSAARCALLMDLTLAGRVVSDPESITVDGTPTGFRPADRLLAAVAAEPEHSLDWWLDRGGIEVEEIAEAAVATGRWGVRRRPWPFRPRYVDLRAEQTDRDSRLDLDVPGPDWTAEDAALVCLVVAAGVLRRPPQAPSEAVLRASAPLEWLCRASAEHLPAAHWRNRGTAMATD
jgi:Golgi phosphoprotein 3 (GPP34)